MDNYSCRTKKYIVSIPRSGQHMTENCLREYHRLMNLDYSYCEYYNCCGKRPCARHVNPIQKDHDFDLKSSINKDSKYLFLYRSNMSRQIEAQFRLDVWKEHLYNDITSIKKSIRNVKEKPGKNGDPPKDFKIDYKDKEVQKAFEMTFNKQLNKKNNIYYSKIKDKWLHFDKENILPIEETPPPIASNLACSAAAPCSL